MPEIVRVPLGLVLDLNTSERELGAPNIPGILARKRFHMPICARVVRTSHIHE
jgi:hypothetical protein